MVHRYLSTRDSPAQIAKEYGVTRQTLYNAVDRFRNESGLASASGQQKSRTVEGAATTNSDPSASSLGSGQGDDTAPGSPTSTKASA